MNKAAEQLVKRFALVPIPAGTKAPKQPGWNKPEQLVTTVEQARKLNGCNLGLAHLQSGTCALDVDDLDRARGFLKARGVDLDALLKHPKAVRVESGRPGRAKLLFSRPKGVEWLPTLKLGEGALELRCATKDGSATVQDVIHGTHPEGGSYELRGDWANPPEVPKELLRLWTIAPEAAEAHPVAAGALPVVTGMRNDYLTSKAGELRRIGMSEAAVLGALRGINASECKPPLSDKEVQTIARSVARYEPAEREAVPEEMVFYGFEDFARLKIPPRKSILDPWLQEQALTMVYGWRGVGKTNFALTAALAIAAGVPFGPWTVKEPRAVTYLDFEMDAATMQKRIRGIVESLGKSPVAPFLLYTPDAQPGKILNLARPEDQEALEPYLEGAAVIVADNLSAGFRGLVENDAESAEPMMEWGLAQRRAGRAVVFLHHENRSGGQRGTSKREDVLDAVLRLKQPDDYRPEQGARFEVVFEKARSFYGEAARPVELALKQEGAKLVWVSSAIARETMESVVGLLDGGLNQRQIAKKLGIHESSVSRAVQKAKLDGLWKPTTVAKKRRVRS